MIDSQGITAKLLELLPIDLVQIANFVLLHPIAPKLYESATNSFFTTTGNTQGRLDRSRITVREDESLCWGAVPVEWRRFFTSKTSSERKKILIDIAEGRQQDTFPTSLNEYINSSTTLAIDRKCSLTPLLSSPLHPLAPRLRNPPFEAALEDVQEPLPLNKKGKIPQKKPNFEGAGMNAKKGHEVRQFCKLVASLKKDQDPPTHAVDVGSGRAHLSRALAAPPLGLHVLAVDWSPTQLAGAERLDVIKTKAQYQVPTTGSLTHQIGSLDSEGITDVLKTWPLEDGGAMLVALHACGDLTVDALKAFVNLDGEDLEKKRKLVAVGCCYNIMTPEIFPLSNFVTSLPIPTITPSRNLLLLTAQAPHTWYLTPSHSSSHLSAIHKLAYRARFQAELESCGKGDVKIGRVGDCESYEMYRKRALERAGGLGEDEVPVLPFGSGEREEEEAWDEAIDQLRFYWTLRSLPGPAVESMLLLDRFAFLVERLYKSEDDLPVDRRRVELVNLFDQATGSLRNVAFVVR
ncbi:hypothetical protein T439DRAFT_375853 [Meredithblackwellia eburnea MCA 4105]